MTDLQSIRDEITARRRRATEVTTWREELRQLREVKGEKWPAAVYRCLERHGKGQRPKLAEALRTPLGIFYVARIDWLPSDQLNLRPWERDGRLASQDDMSYQLAVTDDDYLMNWIEQLDEETRGLQADGPRWLLSAGPVMIVERVEVPPPLGARGLWLRCKDHPDTARALDPVDVMTALR